MEDQVLSLVLRTFEGVHRLTAGDDSMGLRWFQNDACARARCSGRLVLAFSVLLAFLACSGDASQRALSHLNEQRFEEAIAACDEAIRTQPSREAYVIRGKALKKLQRNEEALAAFEEAIRFDPSYALGHVGRADMLYLLDRPEDSLEAWNETVRVAPNHALAHAGRGGVLRSLKRHEEALHAFDEAIRLDPNNFRTHASRGRLLKDMGRFSDAVASYENASRVGVSETTERALQNEIETLQALITGARPTGKS
jgi:tetratricopeptide (TPR) repeat protein